MGCDKREYTYMFVIYVRYRTKSLDNEWYACENTCFGDSK